MDANPLGAETLKVVMVGHVDHGKSTLVGRLLHETGFIPESKLKRVQKGWEDQGKGFEFAFLLDALEEERDQGITIDVSQTFFKTKKRNVMIIDAPGHKEFLKNMISGASNSHFSFLPPLSPKPLFGGYRSPAVSWALSLTFPAGKFWE